MTTANRAHNSPSPQTLVRSLVLLCTLVGGIALIRYTPLGHAFRLSEVPQWREWLLAYGIWSQVIFAALGTLIITVGLPRSAVATVGGALFGPVLGAIWGETASMVAGLVSFSFARWVAGDALRRRLTRFPRLDKQFQENGFLVVLLFRLFPVGHNQLTNFVCGVSSVPTGSFFWGSLLGMFPQSLAYAFLGGSVVENTTFRLACGAGLLLALALGFWWLYRSSNLVADVTKEVC